MTSPNDSPSSPRDAKEAFEALVRWIESAERSQSSPESAKESSPSTSSLVVLAGDAACSSLRRGLSAAADVPPGGVVVRLPWSCAITPTSVLRSSSLKGKFGGREREKEKEGENSSGLFHSLDLLFFLLPSSSSTGLLPGRRLLALRDLLKTPSHPLLPHPWSLLLALGLLCELADPRAPRRAYASLLPTPPGTPIARAAPFGPAATDVLLFGSQELDALCCEPLARAARRERRRLSALHGLLFGGGSGEEDEEGNGNEDEKHERPPLVSLVSFLWAHSLVRSRALDLRVSGNEGNGEVCLLPLIDLAQHDDGKGGVGRAGGGTAPATLRLVSCSTPNSSSPAPPPAAVELVAGSAAGIPKGGPVCLDYGSRPLRDLLRGYAFVPKQQQTRDSFSSSPSSSSSSSCSSSSSEIFEDFSGDSLTNKAALVVDASGSRSGSSSSLLRLASVRLLAEPGGDDAALEFGRARLVFVVVADGGEGQSSSGSGCCCSSSSPVVVTAAPEERQIPMQPEAEVGVCRWASRECEELASRIESWETEEEKEKGKEKEEEEKGNEEEEEKGGEAKSSWLSKAAAELASDYRSARVALLRRCADSLEAQAWLVESALSESASLVNY